MIKQKMKLDKHGQKRQYYYVDFGDREYKWYSIYQLATFEECSITRYSIQTRLAKNKKKPLDKQKSLQEIVETPATRKGINGSNNKPKPTPPADFSALNWLWKPREAPGVERIIQSIPIYPMPS